MDNESKSQSAPVALSEWSASKLNAALGGCGESWRRRYVLNERIPFSSRAMVIGTSVHKAMEADLNGRITGADPLAPDQVIDAALDAFEREAESKEIHDLADDPRLEEARERTINFATAYAEQISPTINNPVASELHAEAEIQVDGEAIHIHGYIDVIDTDPETGDPRIRDLKTGKAFSAANYREALQLSMYSLLGEMNGYGNATLRIDHLRHLKTKGTVYATYEDKRDARHHAQLGRLLVAAIENERAGAFMPNPSQYYCKGCEFRASCDFKYPE